MSGKTYVVRIFSQTIGKWIESVESSLRCAISLTYGVCNTNWTVQCIDANGNVETIAVRSDFDFEASKQFKHNCRAFKQKLLPTFLDIKSVFKFATGRAALAYVGN